MLYTLLMAAAPIGGGLYISEIVDATLPGGQPKFVEITNNTGTSVDLTQYSLGNFNNGGTTLGGGSSTSLLGTLADGDSYVYAYESDPGTPGTSNFAVAFGFEPDQYAGGGFINGDDVVALYAGVATGDGSDAMLMDVYGVIGTDGTGQDWEYTDSYAYRCGNLGNGGVWDASDWTIAGANALEEGCSGDDTCELANLVAAATPGTHAGCVTPPSDIYFTHLYQVDLGFTADPNGGSYVGTNPSAVALYSYPSGSGQQGDELNIAGFNNSGDAGNTAVMLLGTNGVDNTILYSNVYETRPTPGLRGFSGLDITDDGVNVTLVSAFDTGSAVADGISGWDQQNDTKLWDVNARGGSGCAVDPGTVPLGIGGGITGYGAAWTSFGSGRRSLNDLANGANIYTSSDGMIINGAGTGTFWRDMDFNDATGDIWLREGNNLISATRVGPNAVTNTTLVVDEVEADFTAGQNLAHLQALGAVIYNERSSTAGGQAFFDSVRVVNEDGTTRGTNWGGYAPADSNAYYDFSYDAAAGRLAILDFANRTVDVFLVGDAPNTGNAYCFGDGTGAACPCTNGDAGAGCANSDGTSALLTGSGDADVADDKFRLSVSGAKANSFCIFARGSAVSGVTPFGNGIRCIDLAQRGPIVVTDGTGSASRTGLGASVSAGETADYQVFYRDTADTCGGGFNTSNGWTVTWN